MKNRLAEFSKERLKVRVKMIGSNQKIKTYYGVITEIDEKYMLLLIESMVSKNFDMHDILDVELSDSFKEPSHAI
tara:strand:- start:1058 stop:1282 length:225 start_codon:yes stop_codon:yes gene_type:complete